MSLPGKISVKHYLNKNLHALEGKYPLYLLLRFQNKQARIKSRLIFFHSGDQFPLNPLKVDKDFQEDGSYFSRLELASNAATAQRELQTVRKVFEFFRKYDVNIIKHQPSAIIDYSIVPLSDLISSSYKSELVEKLIKNKHGRIAYVIQMSTADFSSIVKALKQSGSADVQKKIIIPLAKHLEVSRYVDRSIRAIEWIIDPDLRKRTIEKVTKHLGKDFSIGFQRELLERIVAHYEVLDVLMPPNFSFNDVIRSEVI